MAVLPDVTWTLTNPLPWETATPRTTQEACTRGPQGRGAGSCRVGLVICLLNACGVCPVILALSPGSLGESLGDTIVLFPSRLCCCPFRRRTSGQARLGVLLPAAPGCAALTERFLQLPRGRFVHVEQMLVISGRQSNALAQRKAGGTRLSASGARPLSPGASRPRPAPPRACSLRRVNAELPTHASSRFLTWECVSARHTPSTPPKPFLRATHFNIKPKRWPEARALLQRHCGSVM